MSFQALAKARWSVRSFQDKSIPEDVMQLILKAGHVAPTARNSQPQRIFVVKSPEARKKLASVCPCTFDAPVILVIGYDTERVCQSRLQPGHNYGQIDTSIVGTHMMLQAWDLGIGSCWVGYFNADQVREALGLPETVQVCSLLPMGYPAEDAKPAAFHSQFRPMAETVEEL